MTATSRRLIIATNNDGKLRELRDLLAHLPFSLISSGELGLPSPIEDGDSFASNALIKARAAHAATGDMSLADDSGLAVNALGGEPGIATADWVTKFGGEYEAMQEIRERVVAATTQELSTQDLRLDDDAYTRAEFAASFHTAIAMIDDEQREHLFMGNIEGKLVWPPRGNLGFGYDPIFQPTTYSKTFGEISREAKHGLGDGFSHRAIAVRKFIDFVEHRTLAE